MTLIPAAAISAFLLRLAVRPPFHVDAPADEVFGTHRRIVRANAVSVKIQWDDGEQITWRRDSLAERQVEMLEGDVDQHPPTPAAPAIEPAEAAAPQAPSAAPEAIPEPTPADTPADEPSAAPPLAAPEPAQESPAPRTPAGGPAAAPTPPDARDAAPAADAPAVADAPAAEGEPAPQAAAKPKRQQNAAPEPKKKRLSAIDAAARILAEAGQAMNCQEMVGAMAAKGYRTSPGGKTPAATLFSAIQRELATKGDQARFEKAGPGNFIRRSA